MSRAALVFVALALLLGVPGSADAQTAGERIEAFGFDAVIEDDGSLRVTETIAYDFGSEQRHGIFREIPTRLTYDETHDRVYRLRDVEVSSETAPDDVSQEDGPGGTTRLRIGDPDRTITGRHLYRITYTLAGALNAFEDHVELYWNAIGTDWAVPIEDITVSVTAPVDVLQTACFAGDQGSNLPCDSSAADGRQRDRHRADPRGAVDAPTCVLAHRDHGGAVPRCARARARRGRHVAVARRPRPTCGRLGHRRRVRRRHRRGRGAGPARRSR